MNTEQDSPGFYGKMPSHGDFISRRLPPQFVGAWDDWLQKALSSSREQLGSDWLNIYLNSPIWRFVFSPQNCGPDAWAGILMPSVDKVGRYFPLTVAASVKQTQMLTWLFSAGAEWFGKLEELALSVLEDDFNFEAFDLNLQQQVLTPLLSDKFAPRMADRQDGPFSFMAGVGDLGQIRDAFVNLSGSLLARFMPTYSLWCTYGSEWVKPSLHAYDGLPPADAYCELLTGRALRQWNECCATSISSVDSDPAMTSADLDLRGVYVSGPITWCSNASSTVGMVRKINQDAYLERSEIGLWAVADGMGGHKSGEVASKAVVKALEALPAADDLETMVANVSASLFQVNNDLLAMAQRSGDGEIIGSTVVVMLSSGNRCVAVWLGDSPLYRHRGGKLTQITRDHSLVNELSRLGAGTREELAHSAVGSVLTKALGAEPDLAVDTISFDAVEGDKFLLCSDGLMRETEVEEVAEILSNGVFESTSRKLIDLALAHGASDNVTVIVVSAGFELRTV